MPSVFPHGLDYLRNRTQWPFQGHNRFWSRDTTYAKANGGQFDFIIQGDYAVPTNQSFWDFLMATSAQWGLVVYEQDWLDDECVRTPPLVAMRPTLLRACCLSRPPPRSSRGVLRCGAGTTGCPS